jgi:thiosulfate/3-mercaptopyruvate sulfurtransferase
MRRFAISLLLIFVSLHARAADLPPLVDAAWVRANIAKPGVVFLDVRSYGAYRAGHIPGAVFTNYGRDGWREKRDGVPGMLPDMSHLERLFGSLGIGNDTHVVIVPGGYGAGEMGVATRVFWTFKVAGLDTISILNGGMESYLDFKTPPLEKDSAHPNKATFKSHFRAKLVATQDDIKAAVAKRQVLLDLRPNDQFLGVNKTDTVKRHGTLPGAVNVPGTWLTEDDGGVFRNADTLKKLFAAANAPTAGELITFCNTGHWSSLGWFVQHEILGNKDVRMYDGSLADWTAKDANPLERKISLD